MFIVLSLYIFCVMLMYLGLNLICLFSFGIVIIFISYWLNKFICIFIVWFYGFIVFCGYFFLSKKIFCLLFNRYYLFLWGCDIRKLCVVSSFCIFLILCKLIMGIVGLVCGCVNRYRLLYCVGVGYLVSIFNKFCVFIIVLCIV